MPDEKTPSAKAAPEQKPSSPPATSKGVDLEAAGASGDPAVHQLLAERQTAVMNREALDVPDADVKAADDAIAAVDKQLAELGFK
jgi:hypothetical protein